MFIKPDKRNGTPKRAIPSTSNQSRRGNSNFLKIRNGRPPHSQKIGKSGYPGIEICIQASIVGTHSRLTILWEI